MAIRWCPECKKLRNVESEIIKYKVLFFFTRYKAEEHCPVCDIKWTDHIGSEDNYHIYTWGNTKQTMFFIMMNENKNYNKD